jgi:outer membrane usher protein FimD/PapC
MKYLGEREVGFDPQTIGFPSIDGCHAIVLVTTAGLYGFHNFGGSGVSSFAERSQSFAAFVSTAFVKPGALVHLYGICSRSKRGYANADKRQGWRDEMKSFAEALGYKGTISGYDLDKAGFGTDSAYVEYRNASGAISIHCKKWSDMRHEKQSISDKVNHKTTANGSVKPISTKIYGIIAENAPGALMKVSALDTFHS